jgi:hypothetical protein
MESIMSERSSMHGFWTLGCLLALGVGVNAAAAPQCTARSGASVNPLVELYTSEGCNSCPPADRWLSALKLRSDVVGLAFHVDYWDRLGWKDRFGSPAFTQRQAQQQVVNGARFSYTPQVVIDGQDRKDWPRARVAAERMPALVAIELAHDGERVTASVSAAAQAPARLAAYWAVTEFGHRTAVKAGENEGATLEHDFVVREYQNVAAWSAVPGAAQPLAFTPADRPDAAHPRKVSLVVVDAASGRPLQALSLGC